MGQGTFHMTDQLGETAIFRQAFGSLDPTSMGRLRQVAVRRMYPAGTVLCREGDPADTFYLITSGRVVISREIEGTDDDFIMGFLGPGQYFGEMAVITDEPRAATVTTLADTDVLEVTKENFSTVFSASPEMARSILQTLIRIIRETDGRAISDLERRVQELSEAYEQLEAAQSDRIARAALEAQLEVAARAQRSLLPTAMPTVPGYQFAARFQPARHIGGDFYDVRLRDDGTVAVLLADVSDKGPHAALFMAVARTLFLTEARYHAEPNEVMHAVHRGLLAASSYDMFVTAIYGVLDPANGVFRFVRAGHEEPLAVSAAGSARFLRGRGRFLGLEPDIDPVFEEQTLQLAPGNHVIIYSDGVIDMRNSRGEPFGRARLAKLATSLRHHDANQLATGIYTHVQQHRGSANAFDDFTLLALRAG